MRTFTQFVSLVLVTFCASVCFAQTAPLLPPVPPGSDRILYLPMGEPAPYSGQLYDNDTAMRWANWLRMWKSRYEIDMRAATNICDIDKKTAEAKRVLEQQKYEDTVKMYQTEINKLNVTINDKPWYSNPWVAAGLGAVGALAITTTVALTLR